MHLVTARPWIALIFGVSILAIPGIPSTFVAAHLVFTTLTAIAIRLRAKPVRN